MSSHTPTMDAAMPTAEGTPAAVWQGNQSHQLAATCVFQPRRSSLVSWTVRVAQVADRIVARAFPAAELAAELANERAERLVEKTLNGLDRCCRLIPTHQGVVTAERARLRIQRVLALRRERYHRFQQLQQTMQLTRETISQSGSFLHLNPVCRWIRISDEPVLERPDCSSGSVLFFLADDDVHGLHMNLEGQVLINELADYQPCTMLQWAHLSSLADSQQLGTLVRQLADIGLVAWGNEH